MEANCILKDGEENDEKFTVTPREGFHARAALIGIIFCGFIIMGVIEHSITVALIQPDHAQPAQTEDVGMGNKSEARRYCDPPNMTALAMYYDSSEEIDNDVNYDFSQLQEMRFEAALTTEEAVESLLKKSLLWGSLISPLPASRLAANIGPKRVFGYGLLGAGAATVLVPAAWLTPAHMVIRFFQGLFYGAMLPSAHMLAINWFPSQLRSKFVSFYSGKYVGYALSELMTKPVMKNVGHDSVFYIIGLMVIIWFAAWSMLVYNTPEKHPKLSENAKKLLRSEAENNMSTVPPNLPWKHVLTSVPVWMSAGVVFGAQCGQTSTEIAMRQYLKFVYNVTDKLWFAIPFAAHSAFAIFCGYLVDFIRQRRLVSTTSSRRMTVYVSHFIPAAMIFVISFAGCDPTAPTILFSLSLVMNGAAYAGAYCSALDLSPNFAGTVFGLCCTFGSVGSVAISYLSSQVLNGAVVGAWRLTFSLTSLILLISSILFMLRGSGSIQFWNNPLQQQIRPSLRQAPTSQFHSDSPGSFLKAKHKFSVEKKILKALHVQEPDRFIRARAYSTNSPARNEISAVVPSSSTCDRKRASIS